MRDLQTNPMVWWQSISLRSAENSPHIAISFIISRQLHPIILTTALGFILGQFNDNGKERAIVFRGRSLNKHERNYTVSERKMFGYYRRYTNLPCLSYQNTYLEVSRNSMCYVTLHTILKLTYGDLFWSFSFRYIWNI